MLGIGLSLAKSKAAKAAPPYQKWGSPFYDSPVLTKDYPYQGVYDDGAYHKLFISTGRYYRSPTTPGQILSESAVTIYRRADPAGVSWAVIGSYPAGSCPGWFTQDLLRVNCDIYTDNTFTTVAFAKNV